MPQFALLLGFSNVHALQAQLAFCSQTGPWELPLDLAQVRQHVAPASPFQVCLEQPGVVHFACWLGNTSGFASAFAFTWLTTLAFVKPPTIGACRREFACMLMWSKFGNEQLTRLFASAALGSLLGPVTVPTSSTASVPFA